MKLPFFNEKKEKSEYYLALLLMDEKASAVILEAVEEKIKIISKHEEFFLKSIESTPIDEFIDIVDKTISKAEEILPPNIETHKTVFGVKKSWIEEETKKINKERLADLKKMCSALDLSPIGFMVTSEAITHLLQEEEGSPLSAILAEVGKNQVNITLLRGGKMTEEISGPLEESAPATVDKLLKHFTVPVLPARIVLFHVEKDEKLTQQFIAYQWSKSLPFLHMPQITILPDGFDARAVTFGAATQMGFEVLDLEKRSMSESSETHGSGNEPRQEEDLATPTSLEEAGLLPHVPEKSAELKDEEPISSHTTALTADAASFGFVMDQDIADVKPHQHEVAEKPVVHEPRHHPIVISHHKAEPDDAEEIEETNIREVEMPYTTEHKSGKQFSLGKILPNIKLPKLTLPHTPLRFIIPLALLLILVLGVVYFYFYKVNANVVLTATPKIVEETASLIFSTTSPNDFAKNVLAAKKVSTNVEGDKSLATTGKKEIGEKAKGKVTIYNNATDHAELSSGTVIKSSNNLLFLLDKDVTVSSASGDVFSGTKPGKTDVAVTAKEIGSESNLPSDTKFTVGGNTTLAVKTESALSGGSKKSITVVSKDDQSKLKQELLKDLEEKAREALTQKAESGESLLPFYTNSGFSKTKFDKGVGDEAKTLKLTGAVSFEGVSYKESELTEYAKSLVKSKYAQDINFAENSVKETIKDAKAKDEKQAQASVIIQAGLLPKIDTEEIAKRLHGKSLKETQQILTGLPQVSENKIVFSPNVPFLSALFSHLPNNIKVTLESK